jgi:hypothetical protein
MRIMESVEYYGSRAIFVFLKHAFPQKSQNFSDLYTQIRQKDVFRDAALFPLTICK